MMRQQTGVREHFSLRQYGSYLDCRAAGFLRGVRARHDLRCMVRPCVRKRFLSIWWLCGLASTYSGLSSENQRACDLISGQASNGPFGSPVFACAGKTYPPSRLILTQTRRAGNGLWGSSLRAPCVYAVPLFVP
jgi:hypothetical protein